MNFNINGYKNYYSSIWSFILRTVITSIAVILSAWVLPGVSVNSVWAAIGAAIVIGLLDNLVRPGIVVATLPFTMASMGCFLFVINAFIILLTSAVIRGFNVSGFWAAMLFSLLLTVFNYLLEIPSKRILNKNFHEKHEGDNLFDRQDNDHDSSHFDDYEDVTEEENIKENKDDKDSHS
jgi:putative membrane protein